MDNYKSNQSKMFCYANHLVRLQLGYPKQLYGWIHYKILAVFPTKTWGGAGGCYAWYAAYFTIHEFSSSK